MQKLEWVEKVCDKLNCGNDSFSPKSNELTHTHTQTHKHNTSATITATARAQSHRARDDVSHVMCLISLFYNKTPSPGSYIRIVKAYISALVQES